MIYKQFIILKTR